MDIKTAIENIFNNNVSELQSNIEKLLNDKSIDAIQAQKQEIAKTIITTEDQIEEKLNKSMSMKEIIDDFIQSDDPRFKNDSKEQRRKRAIAAYYSMHPELKEDDAPSAGLSKEKRSEIVTQAKAGKDIGKSGKAFKDVEAKAKAAGYDDPKAVAAAAMWKNIPR